MGWHVFDCAHVCDYVSAVPVVRVFEFKYIGVERFRILGGPRFRILGWPRGGGQIPSRHMTS